MLALALLLLCILLFALGVFAPNKSRSIQRSIDNLSKSGEDKGDRRAGLFGNITRDALGKARSATDASARAGRRVNERSGGDESAVQPGEPR